jgi:hypothetical protein
MKGMRHDGETQRYSWAAGRVLGRRDCFKRRGGRHTGVGERVT